MIRTSLILRIQIIYMILKAVRPLLAAFRSSIIVLRISSHRKRNLVYSNTNNNNNKDMEKEEEKESLAYCSRFAAPPLLIDYFPWCYVSVNNETLW